MNTITKATCALTIAALTASTFAAPGGFKFSKDARENAPEEIQAIMQQAKEEGRDSITDEQKEVLKAYKQERLDARIAELPEEIRVIAEKKRAGEEISEEEKDTVQAYMEANGLKHKGRKHKNGQHFRMMKEKFLENAPANIVAIAEQVKEDGRESLTDDQKAELKAYGQAQKEAHFASLPEEVQTILTKKKNGEELTDEEKEYLRENASRKVKKGFKRVRGERGVDLQDGVQN